MYVQAGGSWLDPTEDTERHAFSINASSDSGGSWANTNVGDTRGKIVISQLYELVKCQGQGKPEKDSGGKESFTTAIQYLKWYVLSVSPYNKKPSSYIITILPLMPPTLVLGLAGSIRLRILKATALYLHPLPFRLVVAGSIRLRILKAGLKDRYQEEEKRW